MSLGALALVGLFTLSVSLSGARTASAVVGDCTPASGWGTLSQSFADQVLALVNQHRTAMGLDPLASSPALTASAQWKSLHMAYYQYMAHDDPAPPVARAWSDRLAACGYPANALIGENIAYGYATPQDVMTGWLDSPGHRANIESPNYTVIGIGVAQASNGLWFWTQDFGSYADGGGSSGAGAGGGGTPQPVAQGPAAPPSAPASGTGSGGSSAPPAPATVTGSTGSGGAAPTTATDGTPPAPAAPPAPAVSLTSSPPPTTSVSHVAFTYTVTGPADNTTCTLDGGAPIGCGSPAAYKGLAPGEHTFVVTVFSSAGSNSASYTWTQNPPAPRIRFTGRHLEGVTHARVAWTGTRLATSVTCSLDGGPAKPCTSPTRVTIAPRGKHTLTVTASNGTGSDSKTVAWTD